MRQNLITLALCSLAALSAAAPVERRSNNNNVVDEFQSIDGFPTPNNQQVLDIEQRAHGTLSNSTPPASVDPDTIISLQVIAAQEQFEVAFFQQLLTNITNNEPGFVIQNANARTLGLNALTAIVAVSATNQSYIRKTPFTNRLYSKRNYTPSTPSPPSNTSTKPP
jgi:hypothetical protein